MIKNLFGTSVEPFSLGLDGPSFHHGNEVPENSLGENGDLYLQRANGVSMWCKANGTWTRIDTTEPVLIETVWRGEIITAQPNTTIVRVIRNPYTIDTIDITIDSTEVTIDAMPSSDRTTVYLPTSEEGHQIVVKDVTGTSTLWEIDIMEPIDGQSSLTMSQNNSVRELIYSGGEWRLLAA